LELERPLGRTKLDYLVLQLDRKCPHACRYCFIGNNFNNGLGDRNLSLNERKMIVRKASELGARVVSMPGEGEPLAVRGTKELIAYINKRDMVSIIYTKGLLLTPEWATFLAEENATVIISIDSLNEETATKLNPDPPGWFPEAMENIRYAREVFKPLGACRRT